MKKYDAYLRMQKRVYEQPVASSEIVGNYEWNEMFPYETQLLYYNADIRYPLFENTANMNALDFGCGPGRMVTRMGRLFHRVDGADISEPLLREAKQTHPGSHFFLTSGADLGGAPADHYDFVYSTIAFQHICVHTLRMDILSKMREALKRGGHLTIQLSFRPDYPYMPLKQWNLGRYAVRLFAKDGSHAGWRDDKVDATQTNGGSDVIISESSIPQVLEDFRGLFSNVRYWLCDVSRSYDNGVHHNYRAGTHWIFVHGQKQ